MLSPLPGRGSAFGAFAVVTMLATLSQVARAGPNAEGGSISGTVTDSATGLPLSGVTIQARTAAATLITTTTTAADGSYLFSGLPAGLTALLTSVPSHLNYVNEYYDNVRCIQNCVGSHITEANLLGVSEGATLSGIDFALDPAGSVSGVVTDGVSGAPVPGVTVWVRQRATLFPGFEAISDENGQYSISGIPPDTYAARTGAQTAQPYLDVRFSGLHCRWLPDDCDLTQGTPIPVTAGATASVNFPLPRAGRVEGRVTDSATGLPLAGIPVWLHHDSGNLHGFSISDSDGRYSIVSKINGQYYVRTDAFPGSPYIDESYNNVHCAGACDPTDGQVLSLTETGVVTNIDFALELGGTIAGRILDAATGEPVSAAVAVRAYRNGLGMGASSIASGTFAITGLPTGTYFVRTQVLGNLPYRNELYANIPCTPSCTLTTGTPVVVTAGSVTPNIEFTLTGLATIAGTVSEASSSRRLPSTPIQLFDSSGTLAASTIANSTGRYVIGGVPGGSYFVRTAVTSPHIDEVFDNVSCAVSCDPLGGTAVIVGAAGSLRDNVNFVLAGASGITGTVTDVSSGSPLEGVVVEVFNDAGLKFGQAVTNGSGSYAAAGLVPGTYFVRTRNTAGYIDGLYDTGPCTGCNVATGTPVILAGGVTGNIDFALSTGGRIAGRVTTAASGVPIPGVTISIHSTEGAVVGDGITDSAGNFSTGGGLPTGTYFARTAAPPGFLDDIYDGLAVCAPICRPTAGTPIVVTSPHTTTGIDFGLVAGASLIQNGGFGQGLASWLTHATPTIAFMNVSTAGGVFRMNRVPWPQANNQAVVYQPTTVAVPADTNLFAQFDLGNTSEMRLRISVLVHDLDFSDLSVCTFWLEPHAPLRRYGYRTRTTKAWANTTISIYAATADVSGFYEIDNVSLHVVPGAPSAATDCLEPDVPAVPAGALGPNVVVNGDFSAALTPWFTFGEISAAIVGGVVEFIRPAVTPGQPAGVVSQQTTSAFGPNQPLTAMFRLGNSSAVRKRVTVLVHEFDFTDIAACTFWIPPGQALTTYSLRTFTNRTWTHASVSVYPATAGPEPALLLDDVSLQAGALDALAGTECVEPGP